MNLPTVLSLAYVALVFVAIFWSIARSSRKSRREREEFEAAFVGDPDFTLAREHAFAPVRLQTRRGVPVGELWVRGGGKSADRWEAVSRVMRTAARTTLSITTEGVTGRLREAAGVVDVHTGDLDFDRRFCVRGSDEDVVRGILQAPMVRAAVHELFATAGVWRFTVYANGRAETQAARTGLSAPHARAVLERTLALVAALEAHADAPSALRPSTTAALREGASGGSGAPVAVPIAAVDRRRR